MQDLPLREELARQVGLLATQLDKLRSAPLAEPFNGPVLLSGRAAAVYFHEGRPSTGGPAATR
jgi:TldD protein